MTPLPLSPVYQAPALSLTPLIVLFTLALFRMGEKSPPPTSFFPCNFYKRRKELSRKTFWLLVLTIFTLWCKLSRPCLVPVPNYWTWTKHISQKIIDYRSNLYKIVVLITTVIEMLELRNFGHLTTSTV